MTTPKDNGYSVRPLRAEDLERVVTIDAKASGQPRRGYFEHRLAAAVARPADFVYSGICIGERLVGYGFARLDEGEFDKPGAVAALDAIGIAPETQGYGAGKALMGNIVEVLRHKRVAALTTQVGWSYRELLGFLGAQGFQLDGRVALARDSQPMPPDYPDTAPDTPAEIDYSAAKADDFIALSHDRVPVRSMASDDLPAIVAIGRRSGASNGQAYYARKLDEALNRSGVRISLVAEVDGLPAGFIMARLDYGEFGRTEDEAVMDTIGVDPGFRGQGVGRALMSQLMANLSVLRVGAVRTEIDWNDTGLAAYLDAMGFGPAQRITLRKAL